MKEIEDDTNNIPCFWIGRINIVLMTILLKEIYSFNATPIKMPYGIFFWGGEELEQITLKFVWRSSHHDG